MDRSKTVCSKTVRRSILLSSLMLSLVLAGSAFLAGCDPAAESDPTVKVSATGEVPSCCEEVTPSLADARKGAMMKKDGAVAEALPEAPTILDSKEAVEAKAQAAKKTQADKATQEKSSQEAPAAAPLTAASEREKLSTDFTMTDQDGQPFELKNMLGKPTAATFIFTRCANPNMCPLQGIKMANLQKQIEKAGLSDKVNLLVFTFDPAYDTPERLKAWGKEQGIALTNAKLLRPDPREFGDFQYEYRFRAGATADGQITHKTDMMLIDHEGKQAAFFAGMWDDAQVLAHVKELIDAAKGEAAKIEASKIEAAKVEASK